MEGCDLPVILGKDLGGAGPQHQQWTEFGSAHHLPTAPDDTESTTAAQLGNERASFCERLPGSAAAAACSPEPSSKEVSCNDFAASFASLQAYMEPPCASAHPLLPLQEDCGSDTGEEEEEEESDIENLAGEIVYQPDGSAYIVESLSQLSQGGGGLPPLLANCALAIPEAKSGEAAAAVPQVYPQIINTFHIASSFGKWFEGPEEAFPSTSALVGLSPVLHSFRVFDVRHRSNRDYLNSDGSAKSSCVSKDVPNNVDMSKFDSFVLYGKRKPILMCFLCKLSFGFVRSFVSHAVHDHRITLSEEERKILSNKNISAIIQGIGKDKEPLVSFLEPKNKNFSHPLVSATDLISPGHSFYGKFSGIHVEGEGGSQTGVASTSDQPRAADLLAPRGLLNLGGLTSSALKTPITSVPLDAPSSSPSAASEGKGPGGPGSDAQGSCLAKAELAREDQEEEEEEEEEGAGGGGQGLFPHRLEQDPEEKLPSTAEAGSVANGGSSPKDLALSNQSISPSMPPHLLQGVSRGLAPSATPSAPSFVFDGANRRSCLSFNREGSQRPDGGEESANRDDAPELSESLEGGEDGLCLSHHQHGAPLCDLGGEGCPSGGGVECPKCDTVLGSSRSLGGHMTMMHSRNSCKTLKCPKCNWHYKYQQTLEAHMKEKHPEPGGTCTFCQSGQLHPRLARGESYTCGYKPFRCEVCNYSTTTKGNLSIHMQSDKHLNNMQTLQNGSGEQGFSHAAGAGAVTTAAASSIGGGCGAPSPTKPKSKPSWRCEVCDYETNVARNLRIHMTSEKHMHNMVLFQQKRSQVPLGLDGLSAEAELYNYYLGQNLNVEHSPAPEAQFLTGSHFQVEPSHTLASVAPSLVGGEIPLEPPLGGGQLVPEELMNLGETLDQSSDPSRKLFQCAMCNKFTTDALDLLGLHLNAERALPEEEWKGAVGEAYQCRLCHYSTQLKANFQLHCKTEKHLQKYQLVAHIREGGKANEWRLKCMVIGNPLHLKCNACDYYTNSLEKLRLHTGNYRHEASLKLYKHLQKYENRLEGEGCFYHCVLCNYSTKAKLNLVQHVRSLKHQRTESLHKLKRLQKSLPEEEEDLGQIFTIQHCPAAADLEELIGDVEGLGEVAANPDEAAKEVESVADQDQATWAAQGPRAEKEPADPPPSSKHTSFSRHAASPVPRWPTPSDEAKLEQVYHCLYCKYSNPDVNRLRVHVVTQHSIQPMLRCPLCQDLLSNKLHLKLHLTHLHSVSPDCVEKLLLTVTTPEAMMPSNVFPTAAAAAAVEDRDGNEESLQPPESSEEGGKSLRLLPEAMGHGNSGGGKPAASEQPGAREETGFFCWKKGCGQGFKSSSALQAHFSETHGKRPQLPVSDRHVYKYRCNQCSLAFKTIEKLQLHSQYHVIRAATMCCLCQRSFRTLQALKKHLETSHLDLSEADIQQLYSGLLVNGELFAMGDLSLAEDHTMVTEEEKEEENSDQEDKQSPAGSDCGSLQEDSGSEPKRALPFRKGPNFTLEKFLDPARPYKCTVCKESFTQKNILLVHYNSVSHLHKLKRALRESSASQSEATSSPDHKPFKCSICSVAYSQSSTLEIHMRSVLHQTKARAAKLEAVSGSGHSSASLGSSMPSLLGVGTTSLTSPSPSPAAAQCNVSRGSTGSTPPLLSQASCDPTGQPPLKLPIQSSHPPAAPSSPSEPKETNRKKPGDALACRQPLPPPPNSLMQAQLQQELQQQASLLQAQLFSPALLPHFPMAPETLLQQQQLLFPFYFPSAELQLNAEVSLPLTNGTLTLAGSGLGLLEDLKPQLSQPSHPQMQQQQPFPLSQPPCVLVPPSVAPDKKAKSVGKEKEVQQEQEMAEKGSRSPSCQEPLPEASKAQDKTDLTGPTEAAGSRPGEAPWLPPRIAADARGNATKALLENFGFELVIQYNENKQKAAGRVEQGSSLERLECESCSKFFSNVLILKTHQEHVHQHYLPFQQLESFAQQYREHYDQLYPLRPLTPEPAPPPPPVPTVPAAPPQPPSTPTLQVSASPMTSPSLAPNQPSLPHTQLPMPMELPLFSPLMMPTMPLQALPAQLPPQLAPVDSLPAELAQLYQHQLNPGLLQQQQQQQQNKRPRTRITDEQLRVLRQYFDINNSPSEEQIKEMAEKSGLPQKVIKHWFRNTLFKERQRNKDSPYNFSNPPITSLEDLKVDSRPSSPEPQKHEYWGSKRSSRTRFTDYQLRVLQDFFDANAYPKDDEFEQLSSLLNLPTRVIVVWFQNARQKARKNYENQGEGKEGERRELTNDRYIRTSNLNYQCKKCSLVFQRIFDLIKHQKKLCYKDEDEEGQEDSQNEDSMDAMELLTPSSSSCSTPMPSQAYGMPTSSASAAFTLQSTTEAEGDCPAACQPKANAADEKPKHPEPSSMQQSPASDKQRQPKQDGQLPAQDQGEPKLSSVHPKVSPPLQQQPAHPLPQASPPPAQLSHLSHKPLATPSAQQLANLPPQLVPYQCEQCKLAFPSFEHWQEHQQLHFLSTQGQFLHPQFDLPFMLFDPSNPLLASQLLSGTLSQLPMSSATSPSTPTATMSTLKRKLEEKARVSPVGNDGSAGGEEPQRDKRLRTTITPEQLEVLYQKYLLDSNPTRKMLDHIAHEVGLKKRVVQVWFQNTRARERKGQFRAVGPAQAHRRCPFCRALFKAKTALEAHIRSRHWHEAKRAGYNLALSAMLLDCEGGGGGGLMGKGDLFDGANFAQLSAPGSSSDSQGIPPSPGSKSLELSPQTLLSPSSIKVEGMEDLESPSVSSVHLSFDQAKLDNDDCSSVNTALTDTTTGDETNADNDSATGVSTEARGSLGPSEGLTKSAMLAMSEYEDRLSSGLVSPAPSFHSKEYDNEGTVDYSETSSLADPCSPSPGTSGLAGKSGDGGDRPGQKRFRTQMTNLQLKVLKACFSDYRTPTMLECEVLGNDIGLPKRVIQVWFQNARAKEKKSKLNMAKHFGISQTGYEGPKTECTLCGIKYSARLSVRDHIFSEQHISKVKETVGSQLDKEKEYFDPATVRQLMAQQELDRIKKANEALGLAAQQQGTFDSAPLQALNIPANYPAALQSIPPVLLPGLNSPSLPGFTPSNTALTSPKPALMGLPGTSVPSPGLPTSGSPNKTASLSSPPPAQTSVGSATPLPLRKDKESEKAKEKERPPRPRGEALSGPKKDKGEAPNPGPAFPATGSALEYSAEPTQLQALQAALNTESMALLTNPFLPCFVSGFSPYYAPQLPGALQSGYLQPMYTMEGVFPYGPALSQALLGVSPGSLLQHYQQYQQSLQEALQRQVQLPLPKGSQSPVPAEGPSPEKGPAKESPRPEEKNSSHQGSPRRELTTGSSRALDSPLWDPFIVPPVQYRLVCRKCQAGFGSQEAADVHLKSLCCFGQSMGTLPEMALQVLAGGGGSYQCVACESTVCGEEALQQHLESAPHRHHQTVPRAAARNAKEHPSQLPHSACLPDPSTASTSQPTAHPKDGPLPTAPPHASKKPWPLAASPPGKPPPLSSSSTVTSSSCSTSGVQPSLMPRKFSSEESDSGRGPEAGGPAEPTSPRDGGLPSVDPFRL